MVEGRDRTNTDCNYLFSFHILDLNMNEWVPVKERMEVVSSNSVSMGSWYRSSTKTKVQDDLRQKFYGLTGCQRDPRKLGCHSLHFIILFTTDYQQEFALKAIP